METFKCGNCGGKVLITPGSHIGICASCGSEVPLPENAQDLEALFARANELLSQSEFADARHAFDEILLKKPMESAACWGRALSEYGIEYVRDPVTDESLPTFHRLSVASFSEYIYTKHAIEYAISQEMEDYYRQQTELIEKIQKQSLQISGKEEPYDIFLCYKKSDGGESRTPDSRLAGDIYRALRQNGYKVFFAEETLKAGEEYEPRIMAALHSARALVAIATKPEYYDAVWVKNEWGRYVELIENDMKNGGGANGARLLIPMFQHMSREEIPASLRNMPNYVAMDDMINPKQQLLQIISTHFGGGKQTPSAEAAASGIQRALKRQDQRAAVDMTKVTEENFYKRAQISLVNGNFDGAARMFREALKRKPDYADAYIGLMMCDMEIAGEEELLLSREDPSDNENYKKAMEYASPEEKIRYLDYFDRICENQRVYEQYGEKREECLTKAKKLLDNAFTDSGMKAYQKYAELKEKYKDLLIDTHRYYPDVDTRREAIIKFFFLVGNFGFMCVMILLGVLEEPLGSVYQILLTLFCLACFANYMVLFTRVFFRGGMGDMPWLWPVTIVISWIVTMVFSEAAKENLFVRLFRSNDQIAPLVDLLILVGSVVGWRFYRKKSLEPRLRAAENNERQKAQIEEMDRVLDTLEEDMNAEAEEVIEALYLEYATYFGGEEEAYDAADTLLEDEREKNRTRLIDLKNL